MRLHLLALFALLACPFTPKVNASPGLGVAPVPRIALSPHVELAVSPHIFGDRSLPGFFEGTAQAQEVDALHHDPAAVAEHEAAKPRSSFAPMVAMVEQSAVTAMDALLVGLIGWLFLLLRDFMKAHIKNTTALGLLTRLSIFAETQVRAAAQTTVADLKAEPGAWNAATASRVASDVGAQVSGLMGPKGLEALETVADVKNVSALIAATVEAKVHEVSSMPAPVPA